MITESQNPLTTSHRKGVAYDTIPGSSTLHPGSKLIHPSPTVVRASPSVPPAPDPEGIRLFVTPPPAPTTQTAPLGFGEIPPEAGAKPIEPTTRADAKVHEEIDLGNDLRERMRVFIHSTEKVDTLELAEVYLGADRFTPKGELRKQSDGEFQILTVTHFAEKLREHGWDTNFMNGSAHLYTGTHWSLLLPDKISPILGEFAEKMGIPAVNARYFRFRENLLKQLSSQARIGTPRIHEDQVLINLANGTLEITDGHETMREHRKDDLLTYQLSFAYDPATTCPKFDKYLQRVLPDESSRQVLAEFLGWVFIPGLKLEKMLMLLGNGENGKSVFFEITQALLGKKNISTLSLRSLAKMEKRFTLADALLNYGSDTEGHCDAEVLKLLTSGEPIEARRLYKDVFFMHRYARLAFNCNLLPKNPELTHGSFRRFLIVPFTETITPEEKNPDLPKEIIASELPGVFNWVLRGMRRVRDNRRFSQCEAADRVLATYRQESDPIALFLTERRWQISQDHRVTKDTLYAEFREYCKASGLPTLSKSTFGTRLHHQHLVKDSKSGDTRYWNLAKVPVAVE